jgi:phosphate transport system permease protein
MLIGAVGSLLIWLGINGLSNISWDFLTSSPAPGSLETGVAGGILDPIISTFIIVALALIVAFPLGIGTAVFLAEYRRPSALARLVDTSVDMIFGVPSIVFALFGLAIFTGSQFIFLSTKIESSGLASATSFFTASLMLAMIAFPPIVRATESAITAVSNHQREASYALGKGKLTTIRKIVLPGARPGIITGVILGIGRVIGDTAVAVILLGGTVLAPLASGWWHPDNITSTLRGEGSTLTTYIYYASPAGEGNTPGKAYGAAFVLMIGIVIVNGLVRIVGRRRSA